MEIMVKFSSILITGLANDDSMNEESKRIKSCMKTLDDDTIEYKVIPNLSIQTKTRDIVDYVGKGSQNSV